MLELYKKRLKNNKGMVLPLLIYTAALFWVAWLLIEQCIDAPRSLRSVVYLLFAIVSIEQLIISWRKLTRVETKVEKDEEAIQNISWQEWQQAMLKNDLSQIPSSVIAVFIISIPIVLALAFIVFKSEIFTTSYITNPEYERFNNYSSISIAIALLIKDIPELFNIEQKVFKRIFNILLILAIFTGLTLYALSANYLTEVTFKYYLICIAENNFSF